VAASGENAMEVKRFVFNIKTNNGCVVKNLKLIAPDYVSAESRLVAMYRFCQILEMHEEIITQRDKQLPDKIKTHP
jgi:hypothetical protein